MKLITAVRDQYQAIENEKLRLFTVPEEDLSEYIPSEADAQKGLSSHTKNIDFMDNLKWLFTY